MIAATLEAGLVWSVPPDSLPSLVQFPYLASTASSVPTQAKELNQA